MKFDRQLRPATETSWVVSYNGKTIPRWQTAAILKIDISPYLNEKSSDFDEILCTLHNSRFWTGWTSRDQKWNSCIVETPSLKEHISCHYNELYSMVGICTVLDWTVRCTCPSRPILTYFPSFHGFLRWAHSANGRSRLQAQSVKCHQTMITPLVLQ